MKNYVYILYVCLLLISGKSPFYGKSMRQNLKNIAECEWSFTDDFQNVSQDAKDFMQRLFNADPKERMTAQQALNHPWLHYAAQQQTESPQLSRQNLMDYHSRRVWSKQARQQEPWIKLVKISSLLDQVESPDTGISSASLSSLGEDADIESSGSKSKTE